MEQNHKITENGHIVKKSGAGGGTHRQASAGQIGVGRDGLWSHVDTATDDEPREAPMYREEATRYGHKVQGHGGEVQVPRVRQTRHPRRHEAGVTVAVQTVPQRSGTRRNREVLE